MFALSALFLSLSLPSTPSLAVAGLSVACRVRRILPCRVECGRQQQSALAEEVRQLEQQQAWLRETFSDVFDEVMKKLGGMWGVGCDVGVMRGTNTMRAT